MAAVTLAVVLAAGGLSACSKPSSDSSGPIKIGILEPFTGAYSNYGPDGLAGVKLALSAAGYKVGKRKITLVQGNENVLDPSQTVSEAKRLVQQQGVKIMVGPVFGSSQQAVAPYFKQNDVMSFVPYGATKELGGTGNVVSWPSLDTQFSTPLGGYLADVLKYKRIATLAPDYVYGHNVIAGAVDSFEAAGGSVVQKQFVPLGTNDLLPYASKLSRNIDALVMWLVPTDEATFLRALRSLNITTPVIFVNGMFDPTFQQVGSQVAGSYGLVDWSLGLKNSANQAFIKAFRAANANAYPDNNNAAAYTDTELALATIAKAHGSTAFADLKKAVTTIHLDTPYGPGSVDKNFYGVTDRTVVKASRDSSGRYVWEPIKTFTAVPNTSS